MSQLVTVLMRLPQHPETYTNEQLYRLFRRRVFEKSNFKDPTKNPPVLILNLSDGDRNYQMGVPIEQGSFFVFGAAHDIKQEYGFIALLAGNVLGDKWSLHVYKNGQAFLKKEKKKK